MALTAGAKLGPYEVLSLIGAGGMGEVYRARDPRLHRDVAIKVLPADRVSDEDRRRRFVQEAQAASALNHPHIITIHEIESADGNDFIVMEYLRGKSLDALIPQKGMRLGELLRIAIPVADALAAAHARGIIHRDLKPANVMVGQDGAVKVLDFGLAKLVSGDSGAEEGELTHTAADVALSMPGTIAGTAAYMSPEQASGGKVDARSDIFSFGAMLYEMVTGARAFAGTSTADTLAAVVRAQPKSPTAIVPGLPSDFEKVILRCLRKDPERRFQHIGDVKVALQDIKEESESGAALAAAGPRGRRRPLIAAFAGTLVLIAAIAAWLLRPDRRLEAPPLRVVPLTTLAGHERSPTFSPDGEQVAFTWDGEKGDNLDIYVTIVGSSEVRRLTSDPAPDSDPTWSPDGRQIAFLRERSNGNTIQLVSPLGGSDHKLSDFRGASSISWSPDGRWLAAGRNPPMAATTGDRGGIYLIPVQGGEPRDIVRFTPLADYFLSSAFSADGRRLAYASCQASGCHVYLLELDAALAPTGPPRRLTSQALDEVESLAWTRDGMSVVYGAWSGQLYLWRLKTDGQSQPERLDVAGLGAASPTISRSGDRLAFARVSFNSDIYRFEPGHPAQAVAASTFRESEPSWSADGRRFAFSSLRSGDTSHIWVAAADGSAVQQLTYGPGHHQGAPWWSPDGSRIAFDSVGDDQHWHIWIVDADGGTPHQLTNDPGNQNVPSWSHDGRWIYFSADPGTGRNIWRVPASGGPSQPVTRGGSGLFACESADGNSLLYQTKDEDSPLLAMPPSGGPARQLVACVKFAAFAAGPHGVYYAACDPSPDPALHVMEPDTGRDRLLGRLEKYGPLGLSVSPDGKSILYVRHMSDSADLMLIENFR